MRPIMGPDELEEKVLEGRREAVSAFGNGEGYLEKMILNARHVEVQILGDKVRRRSTTSGSATARCSAATRRWSSGRRRRT